MTPPLDAWQPLAVDAVRALFVNAPFAWALAGGYAVEQFLGRSIRAHGDIDVIVFRDEQRLVHCLLAAWRLYAADPPGTGTLRPWPAGEYLPPGIHDIWGHHADADAWQMQLMLIETDGTEWFSRRNALIRGPRDELITTYNAVPCIRIEVQLLYKARSQRPKDDIDFHACLPRLDAAAKHWLAMQVRLLHPEGHAWLDFLK